METVTKRERTTKKQIEMMVDFIVERMPKIEKGGCYEKEWEELKNILNGEKGPMKNVNGWKKVFKELKTNAKRRGREVGIETEKTGGGISVEKPLTVLEQKILSLIAKVCTQGADVPELGLLNEEQTNINDMNMLPTCSMVINDDTPIIFEQIEHVEHIEAEKVPPTQEAPRKAKDVCKQKRRLPRLNKGRTSIERAIEMQVAVSNNLATAIHALSNSILALAGAIRDRKQD